MSALPKHATPASSLMIASQIFGEIEIGDDQLLSMPDGLLGFPVCTEFALLPSGYDGFYWLQSTKQSTVAFLIVDPFVYFDSYTVDLTAAVLQRLETTEPSHVSVYSIVTLPGKDTAATANLQGPLIFNVRSRQGFQAVIQDSEFGTRERIPREALAAH